MSLYVVPVTARHARQLGPHLREADAIECQTLTGLDSTSALLKAIEVSTEVFTAMSGSTPVGMFGHRDMGDGVGVIWMLGSPKMTADLRDFLGASSEWWERITSRYDVCVNRVWEGNRLHASWLAWMGCRFADVTQLEGDPPRPFRNFHYVRTSNDLTGALRRGRCRDNRGDSSGGESGQGDRDNQQQAVQLDR